MHYELFLTGAQRAVRNGVARNSGNYNNYVNNLTSWYNSNALFNDASLEGFPTSQTVTPNWCGVNNMYVILDLHAAPGAAGYRCQYFRCIGRKRPVEQKHLPRYHCSLYGGVAVHAISMITGLLCATLSTSQTMCPQTRRSMICSSV